MIYNIEMSKGPSIKIDEEDLVHIQKNIAQALIRVKQGIINPSFMISIIPTEEKDTRDISKIEIINGRPTLISTTKSKTISDKMNINNIIKLP